MEENQEQSLSDKNRKIEEVKPSEVDRLKTSLSKREVGQVTDRDIEYLINKLEKKPIVVNRPDYYGNSIPLGAFCYAVSFVLFGFYESKIKEKPDKFTYLVLFFFGGIGQITTGIFEYIKARTFPTIAYILYGVYFISFTLLNLEYSSEIKFGDYKKVFFGTWAGLCLPIFIASIKTNLIYLVQNLSVLGFFVVKCIAECKDKDVLRGKVAGILELITGFFSLYLGFTQIINEHFKKNILPTIKLKQENEIDI